MPPSEFQFLCTYVLFNKCLFIYFNFVFNLNFRQVLVWYAFINMVHVGDNGNHCHNIQVGDQDNIHHLIQERNEFPQDSKDTYAILVSHFYLLPAFLPFLELFHFQELPNDHVFCIGFQGPR